MHPFCIRWLFHLCWRFLQPEGLATQPRNFRTLQKGKDVKQTMRFIIIVIIIIALLREQTALAFI